MLSIKQQKLILRLWELDAKFKNKWWYDWSYPTFSHKEIVNGDGTGGFYKAINDLIKWKFVVKMDTKYGLTVIRGRTLASLLDTSESQKVQVEE